MGGDEFVIYIQNTFDEIVARIAENLRLLAESTLVYWEGQQLPISLSIGTVNYKAVKNGHASLETLLSFADKAMYQSKQHGSNYVSAYEFKQKRVTDKRLKNSEDKKDKTKPVKGESDSKSKTKTQRKAPSVKVV